MDSKHVMAVKGQKGPSHSHGAKSSVQLSAQTWQEFDRFFSENNGVWGGCWCMFFHAPGSFNSQKYKTNRAAKHSLVDQGRAHGTIVYCGKDPVGWCQFGPKEELPRVDTKRGYKPTAMNAWRITCLFVSKGHRGSGFAEFAVKESVSAMRKLRVRNVESYPVEGKRAASLLWSGTPEIFEESGFSRVGPLGKTSWIYALELRGR
jgi:hypothetical protein